MYNVGMSLRRQDFFLNIASKQVYITSSKDSFFILSYFKYALNVS